MSATFAQLFALLLALTGTDCLGDPLGPGVTARHGTTRLIIDKWNIGKLRFHPTRDELYLSPFGQEIYPDLDRGHRLSAWGWKLPKMTECCRAVFRYSPGQPGYLGIGFDATGRYRYECDGYGVNVIDGGTGRKVGRHTFPDKPISHVGILGVTSRHLLTGTYRPAEADKGKQESQAIVSVQPINRRNAKGYSLPVLDLGDATLSARGDRLWVTHTDGAEVREHAAATGQLRSWQRLPMEPDTDPFRLFRQFSSDGTRLFVIQCRQDEKADRYRGRPECFVHVFNTAEKRLEARYEFRLDDAGGDEPPQPTDEEEPLLRYRHFTASDDGRFIAWTDPHGRLLIRHLATGRVVKAPGGRYHACSMAFSPNGKRLAVLDRDNIVRLIHPYTGRFQHTADSPSTAAKQAAVSPDGKLVATGHACGEVWVWDAATGKPLWHTEADGEPVRELHFNPTGTTVSAVGFWGPAGVRTFDAKTGKELGPMLPYRYFRTLAVSADGKRISDLIEEKSIQEKGGWAYPLFVRTREVATGKELNRVRLDHRLGLPNETSGVISRDGRVMVVTHTDSSTFAYDTATGKRLCEMQPSNGSLAVSADGRLALSASLYEGHIWDTSTGTETGVVKAPLLGQCTLEFSECGRSVSAHFAMVPDAPATTIFDIRSQHATLLRRPIATLFPDGKSFLSLPGIRGAERVSLEPLAWKVAPPPKPTEARLKELWKQLGEPAALEAVFELARHPAEAVPFLKANLLTDSPDAKAVADRIDKLGSKLFTERDAATKALRELGPEVLPALRAALKAAPSPEARSRIDKLLPVLADTAAPFTLTRLRAVEALERCGTPDARAVLKVLADTRPGTSWADDAARALVRLGR